MLDEVAGGNTLAPGLLYYPAGVGEDGLVVFEVWESQEVLQQFFEEQLGQALQRANINVQPKFVQIVNTMQA